MKGGVPNLVFQILCSMDQWPPPERNSHGGLSQGSFNPCCHGTMAPARAMANVPSRQGRGSLPVVMEQWPPRRAGVCATPKVVRFNTCCHGTMAPAGFGRLLLGGSRGFQSL